MTDGELGESVVPGDMIRELDEFHKLFDALGVGSGFAADRVHAWFQHKLLAFRSNGHSDGCQCQVCSEARLVAREYQRLRPIKLDSKTKA
jgi:hypothetical protein